MFELFLNAVRLAASDDARESVSSILTFIRKLPEWERDICTLEARIAPSYAEQATLLSTLADTKLKNLAYSQEATQAFNIIYSELVANAFEHGRKRREAKIRIILDITRSYIAVSVINASRSYFYVDESIQRSKTIIQTNPYSKRGRGLIAIAELADEVCGISSNNGIKAVIYRDRVSFELVVFDNLTVIRIVGGIFNPSMKRRLIALASRYLENNLILDFSLWGSEKEISITGTVTLELNELYTQSGSKVVAWIRPYSEVEIARSLPSVLVAHSLKSALQKVDREHLLKRVQSKLKEPSKIRMPLE